jgi:hypothetical protein
VVGGKERLALLVETATGPRSASSGKMVIVEAIVVRRGGWFQGKASMGSLTSRSARMTTERRRRCAPLASRSYPPIRLYVMNPIPEQD